MCAASTRHVPPSRVPVRRIEWRYIINDAGDRQRQWVTGKIRSKRQNPEASWVFIRRTALQAQNSKLPTIETPKTRAVTTKFGSDGEHEPRGCTTTAAPRWLCSHGRRSSSALAAAVAVA